MAWSSRPTPCRPTPPKFGATARPRRWPFGRQRAHKLVWLDVPIALAALIPVATQRASSSTTAMRDAHAALSHPARCARPHLCHPLHRRGRCGAQRPARAAGRQRTVHRRDNSRPYYKLPGGALHPGEHMVDAVVREVLEETGVHAKFEALVCFRHWHGYRWNKSDIYFICRLVAHQRRNHHPARRDRRIAVDAGGRISGERLCRRLQQAHRPGRAGQPRHCARLGGRLCRPQPATNSFCRIRSNKLVRRKRYVQTDYHSGCASHPDPARPAHGWSSSRSSPRSRVSTAWAAPPLPNASMPSSRPSNTTSSPLSSGAMCRASKRCTAWRPSIATGATAPCSTMPSPASTRRSGTSRASSPTCPSTSLLGGKCREAAAVYVHADGRDPQEVVDNVRKLHGAGLSLHPRADGRLWRQARQSPQARRCARRRLL